VKTTKITKMYKSQIVTVFGNTMVKSPRLQTNVSASPITSSIKSGKFAGHKHICKPLETPGRTLLASTNFITANKQLIKNGKIHSDRNYCHSNSSES
jgi:hypothetical protein